MKFLKWRKVGQIIAIVTTWSVSCFFCDQGAHMFFWEEKKLLYNPSWHYMRKVNNRYTRTRSEICSKSRRKTLEQCHWRGSGALIVNFNYISCFAFSIVLIVDFEHVMPIGIVNKITSTVKTTNYILIKLSINLD